MRCTRFAVNLTDSISLLSRAPVRMTLHNSAYYDITERRLRNVGIHKKQWGITIKGFHYIVLSLYGATAVYKVLLVAFGKIHVFSRHKITILPCIAQAVAQFLEVVFGKNHVGSSPNIVIFTYAAPAVAKELEVAFGKIQVGSSLTIVIFSLCYPGSCTRAGS